MKNKLLLLFLFCLTSGIAYSQVPSSIYILNNDGSEDTTGRYQFLIMDSWTPEGEKAAYKPYEEFPGIEKIAHSFGPKKRIVPKILNDSILTIEEVDPAYYQALRMSQPPDIRGSGLAIVDSITNDTMIIHSGGRLGAIKFTPGEFYITSNFSYMYQLTPDSGITITNRNIEYFDAKINDSTRYAWYNAQPIKGNQLALLSTDKHGVIVATGGLFYRTYDGAVWDTFRYFNRNREYITSARSIDDEHFSLNILNRSLEAQSVLLYKEGAKEPAIITFPDSILVLYVHTAAVNNIYAIACTKQNRTDYILYQSTDTGKTWSIINKKMRHEYKTPINAEFIYLNNKLAFIGNPYRREIIAMNLKGDIPVSDEEIDYNPHTDTSYLIYNYSYEQMLVVKKGGKYYFVNSDYKGLNGKFIHFNGNEAVIAMAQYILVSHDGGISWKYYPFRDYSVYDTYKMLPGNKLVVHSRTGIGIIYLNEL